MRVVNMLVEGMTEHRFVGQVLKPYLMDSEVLVVPTIVKTKHSIRGTWERGGVPPRALTKSSQGHDRFQSRGVSGHHLAQPAN